MRIKPFALPQVEDDVAILYHRIILYQLFIFYGYRVTTGYTKYAPR
jgi:hypothetical protein